MHVEKLPAQILARNYILDQTALSRAYPSLSKDALSGPWFAQRYFSGRILQILSFVFGIFVSGNREARRDYGPFKRALADFAVQSF